MGSAQLFRVGLKQGGEGVDDLGHRELAVAGPDQGRQQGVGLSGTAQTALLTQHEGVRVLGPGCSDSLLPSELPRLPARPASVVTAWPQSLIVAAIGCSTS